MSEHSSDPEPFLEERLKSENLRHNIRLKRYTGVTMLNRQSYELSLGVDNLRALNLTRQSTLHAVLLLRRDKPRTKKDSRLLASTKPPVAVMVATPVPPETWGRAVRMCFTLESKRGELYRLIKALREANLYVRHVDSGDGLCVEDFQIVGPGLQRSDLKRSSQKDGEKQEMRNAIRPTTILTVEVPRSKVVRDDDDCEGLKITNPDLLRSIHAYLDAWKVSTSKEGNYKETLEKKIEMVNLLDEAINPEVAARTAEGDQENNSNPEKDRGIDGGRREPVRIEWVSPLQALASLKDSAECDGPDIKDACEYLPVFLSNEHNQGLCVSLACWKKLLDPTARNDIESSLYPGIANFAAVVTTDREERTLTAEFLSLEHYAVMQFEIVFPTGRGGHRWKEWIMQIVNEEGGGVLRMFSMGRLEGRWGREVFVTWFPFTEAAEKECNGSSKSRANEKEDEKPEPSLKAIKRIIRCVRALKGFVQDGFEYDLLPHKASIELKKYIDEERENVTHQLIRNKEAKAALGKKRRLDTTLRDVKIWYRWPQHTGLGHRRHFRENPFYFTRPLDYKEYVSLYKIQNLDERMSRLRLADRICQRLRDPHGGSVILVGAHRSGKTSVMNMVLDILGTENDRSSKKKKNLADLKIDGPEIVGIRINASVTPAHLFLFAINRELENVLDDPESKLQPSSIETAKKFSGVIKKATDEFIKLAKSTGLNVEFELPGVKVSLSKDKISQDSASDDEVAKGDHDEAGIERLIARREREGLWDSPEGQAAFLRKSIEFLRSAIDQLEDKDCRLVVAMDEISESAAWGNNLAFPVWRHLIESQDFKNLRWLFSSTRPPTAATGYSPLSNALHEYTMGPLNDSEASQLIDNFDSRVETRGITNISLVITHGAREFIAWVTGQFPYLIQVVCVYVYDRAIGYHIPVVTSALVRQILKDHVIPALTEYFQAQWSGLPKECKKALKDFADGIDHPLGRQGYNYPKYGFKLDPQTARCVRLAGLGQGDGGSPLTPAFAYWLSQSSPET